MGLRSTTVTLALILIGCAQAGQVTRTLPSFQSIEICTPLNVKVEASEGGNSADGYQLLVSGKRITDGFIIAEVERNVLTISTSEASGTQEDLAVTVRLPAESLQGVSVRSAGSVFIAAGFKSSQLRLSAETLAGSISAVDVKAKSVLIRASGLSEVFIQGELQTVEIVGSDTASIIVSGVKKAASLNLRSLARAEIESAQGAQITGTAEQGTVRYRGGACSAVKASALETSCCVEDSKLKLTAPTPFLECTVTLDGPQTCATGARASSSAAKTCRLGFGRPQKAGGSVNNSRRRLRQTDNAFAAAQALLSIGSTTDVPTSYTFTSTSSGSSSGTSVTTCSFVNNQGGCQVNGTSVPVDIVSGPVPAPGPAQQALIARIANSLSAGKAPPSPPTTTTSTNAVTSVSNNGGTSTSSACTFVNGVGGCTTG